MSAIRFVVSDGTGNLQRGTVLENGDTATLNVGSSQDISLNLRRSEVASFDRQGSDLVVTLTDGSVLTLGGYFVEPRRYGSARASACHTLCYSVSNDCR